MLETIFLYYNKANDQLIVRPRMGMCSLGYILLDCWDE